MDRTVQSTSLAYVATADCSDAVVLSQKLRKADLDEIQAATGEAPHAALLFSFHASSRVYTIVDGGLGRRPLAMFGVVDAGQGVGVPWLVAAEGAVGPISKAFLRGALRWLPVIERDFTLLTNFTDARNTVHHRWLQWMGFSAIRLHPQWGAAQLPFYEFVRITPCAFP